ncbi:MAG: hypothetical protein U0573_12810 [Phycisphaerales bacterium]|nr:hypothetical protein [Planctomycetota bacterium]
MTGTGPTASLGKALAWSVYLGVSWTWCIGMFLPVLMLRDYGPWGFAVFAVPNVVGAALMGWVLRTGEASLRMCRSHASAVRLFSLVTILFHLYFVWYLTQAGWVQGPLWPWIAIGVFSLSIFTGLKTDNPTEALWPWGISVTVIAFALYAGIEIRLPAGASREFFGIPAVAWIAPVCIFGFLLCPYLDLTFHRARQSLTPRDSKVAFGVGFCAIFLAMIVFTAVYAGWLLGLGAIAARVPTAILLHMLVQAGFTTGLHIREGLRSFEWAGGNGARTSAACVGAIGLVAGAAALVRLNPSDNISPAFELGYRVILSAYGLLLPAYVWLIMIPLRSQNTGPSKANTAVWLGACALAAPAYWMGFIEGKEWWLAPGLAIVLAARVLISSQAAARSPTQDRPPPETPGSPKAT